MAAARSGAQMRRSGRSSEPLRAAERRGASRRSAALPRRSEALRAAPRRSKLLRASPLRSEELSAAAQSSAPLRTALHCSAAPVCSESACLWGFAGCGTRFATRCCVASQKYKCVDEFVLSAEPRTSTQKSKVQRLHATHGALFVVLFWDALAVQTLSMTCCPNLQADYHGLMNHGLTSSWSPCPWWKPSTFSAKWKLRRITQNSSNNSWESWQIRS